MRTKPDQSDGGSAANDDPPVGPAVHGAITSELLQYLAAMIAELHEMAKAVPQSSLQSILDSAITETQFQLARCAK